MEQLASGWEIADTRVIGVQVEVLGAPGIAAPAPGDTARLTVLLAEPPGTETEPIGWGFAAGPAFLGGVERPITFDVPIPSAAILGTTRAIRMAGIVCSNGVPTMDATTGMPTCGPGTTRSTTLTYTLALARDGVPANRNPVLGAGFATLDGVVWEPAADGLPITGCAALAGSAALPLVHVSTTEKLLHLFVDDAARETYARSDGTSAREIITLSQFTSGGDLQRQFSVWEGDAVALPDGAEVKWTPTGLSPNGDGALVRFWFVARDGRGGLGWTTRAACVVP
jgi:hypothetical protein